MVGGEGTNVGPGLGGAILAHWRNDCPVAEGSTTNLQRCEESRDFLAIALFNRRGRGHGVLRDEVRQAWDGLVVCGWRHC